MADIRKREPTYVERQAKWIKENNIKINDNVRIIRTADSREDDWRDYWHPYMDEVVGKVGRVSYVLSMPSECGIQVNIPDLAPSVYPYFVLEKVETSYVPYDLSDLAWRTFLLEKPVKAKNGQSGPALIVGFSQLDGGMWRANVGGIATVNAGALLDNWVFLDGTPCGKLVEEKE